jgi:hypothetical protein
MNIFSEKDKSEKEEEEVERNVRKSPEKKPPRKDKERRNIKEDDKDTDSDPDTSEDKDLSMNYKDIGGSVVSRYRRFLSAEDDDSEEEEDSKEEEEGDEAEDSENEDQDQKERNEDKDNEDNGDEEEESENDSKEEQKQDSIDPLDDKKLDDALNLDTDESGQSTVDRIIQHALTGRETDLDKPVKELAVDWYNKSPEELSSVILSGSTDKEKEAARRAIHFKKAPLPPRWDLEGVFEAGVLKLEAKQQFKEHMKDWDEQDFDRNLDALKENSVATSITDGSDLQEDYHEALIEFVGKIRDKFIDDSVNPLEDIDGAIPDVVQDKGDVEFNEDQREKLRKQVATWRKRLKKTTEDQVKSLIEDVRSEMDEIGSQLSLKYAWYSVLWNVLKGALVMKKAAEQQKKSSRRKRIASKVIKRARYGGLPGPVEGGDSHNTDWEKPDPLDLDVDDYLNILEASDDWLNGYLSDVMANDGELACRLALDYAIFNYGDGVYDGVVDSPTYHDLLQLLEEKHLD